MAKYRKKPVTIEAIQWVGNNLNEILNFSKDAFVQSGHFSYDGNTTKEHFNLAIKTLEGTHMASIGDYIIKGVKGECYPCKPDIFEMTYDLVE